MDFSMAAIMPCTLPPAADVDERKAVADEIVAHVDDIVLREKDDGVAVGVAGGKVQRADVFAVEVDGDVVLEGDDGERGFFGGLVFHLDAAAVAGDAAGFEALANVVLGDDASSPRWRRAVPAGVIAVIVGVDDEADGLVGDAEIFQGGVDFVGERREFVVNDDDAVFADRRGDIAARAFEHIDVAGNFGDFDLDFGEVLLLGASAASGRMSC